MTKGQTRQALGTLFVALRGLLAVRWMRRVAIIVLLGLLARAGLEQLLGAALNRVAARFDLECEWEDLSLSLLLGKGRVHYLEIRSNLPTESGSEEPLLVMEYAVFDLEVLDLLRGSLSIARAEVDGLDARLIREATGDWNLGQHIDRESLLGLLRGDGELEEPVSEETESTELDFSVPFSLGALRFQNATCRVVDHTFDPPKQFSFELNAALSNLNDSARPIRFSAAVLGGDLINSAHMEGQATVAADAIQLGLRTQVGGVHTRTLSPYLAELDIRPACETIAASALATIDIAVIGEARDTLEASVQLTEVRLVTDGVESLALDRLKVGVDSFSPSRASLPAIEITGIRGRASLEVDGALRIAGLDFTGTRWLDSISELSAMISADEVAPDVGEDTSAIPSWLALLYEKDADAYAWSLDSFRLTEGVIAFTDRSVEPESRFPIYIDLVGVGEVVHEPGEQTRTIPIDVNLRAPGLAETIDVQGHLGPFAPERSIDLKLQVEGIALDALAPHMLQFGIERTFESGSFHVRLRGEAETDATGKIEGQLALEQVALVDGGQLFGVESMQATGLVFDPSERLLRFGNLELSGTHLTFGRDPSAQFFAVGLRTLGMTPDPQLADPTPVDDREETSTLPLPTIGPKQRIRVEFGRLAWVNSAIEFVDEGSDPVRRFHLEDLEVELTNLTLGGEPGEVPHEPAIFKAHLAVPGILEEVVLEGRVHSQPGPVDLSLVLALQGSGVDATQLLPYLNGLGIQPTYTAASVSMEMVAKIQEQANGLRVGLELRDMELREEDEVLLSCEAFVLEGLELGNELGIESLRVVAPYILVSRDEQGALHLGGVRLASGEAGDVVVESPHEVQALSLPVLPGVRVGEMTLTDAQVSYVDASLTPELESQFLLEGGVQGFATDGTTGLYQLALRVPGTVESLDLFGTFSVSHAELSITADVSGSGVQAGPFSRLLPQGMELESSAAELQARVEARLQPAEAGGLRAEFHALDVVWGQADERPWFAAESAHLVAPRLDPVAGVITLGPITADGVHLNAVRGLDGAIHLLGFVLGEPGAQGSAVSESSVAAADESKLAAPLTMPRIEFVDEVTLNLVHLGYRDESLGDLALPIEATTRFQLETPALLVDADPEGLAPVHWQCSGSLPGMVEHWSLAGQVAPFAIDPSFEANFVATGVRTAGVIERAPALAGLLEGEVEQGTMAASMNGVLYVRRARPTELGLSRPFSAEMVLEGVEYRDQPEGTILAGVDRVLLDVKRVDLAKDLVHLEAVEILRPRGTLRRKDMTVHALGFAVNLNAPERPAEAIPPAEEGHAPDQIDGQGEGPGDAAPNSQPNSAPELRVDRIIVSGLGVELLDETVEPAVRIPLTDLDAELTRFTSRALVESRPIHFSSFLRSSSGEASSVFEEVVLAGRVSLYPEPSGWTQFSVTGLELNELAPLAAVQGLEIEDGALDVSIRMRLKGESGAAVDASLVFTDLDMDEPEGGFLAKTLSLPVALDSALFLLKNADGEHRFSTGFNVDEDGVSGAAMVAAAGGAFSEVIARAIAAVPLRLLGALLPSGSEDSDAPSKTWTLDFFPGATEPSPASLSELRLAATRLKHDRSLVLVLRHELSAEDVAQASRMANPPESTCLELIRGLRRQKVELLRSIDQLTTETHALYVIGSQGAPLAGEALRARARELASVEDALDRLFDILTSRSDRQRQKRTRHTAREMAQLRLNILHDLLLRQLRGSDRERVEVRAPRYEVIPGSEGGRVLVELMDR